LTTLDISKIRLTRGALKTEYDGSQGFHYETELRGKNTLLWRWHFSSYHTYFFAGIIAIANAIPDMKALTSLDMSSSNLTRGTLKPNDWAGKSYEADWGEKDYHWETDVSGVATLGDAIKDMGAISSVNFLKNGIGTDQAKKLVGILKEHPTLKSLCGNTGNEIELDMSGKMHGTGDVIMLVPEIIDNGALSKLVVRQNNIHNAEAGKAFSNMLAQNTVLKELDLSSQKVGEYGYPLDPAFVKEFAVGISDNSALLQLDISDHVLSTENERAIAKLCDAKGIRLTLEAAMPSAFGGGNDY
jgi:hypothetical protein